MNKFVSPILAATMLAGIALSGCNTMDKYFSEDYVLGALDASYKGDFDKYLDTTDGKEEDAQELYDNTVDYYTEVIAQYCDVYTEDISDEVHDKYTEFTKELLLKADYTIASSENGKETCYVKIVIKPINILEQSEDDIAAYIEEFNTSIEEIGEEINNYTDEQFQDLEDDYAENVLNILKEKSNNLEYKDTITFTMEIKIDKDGLYSPANEDDWNTIDDYVMGIYE